MANGLRPTTFDEIIGQKMLLVGYASLRWVVKTLAL